MIQDYLLIGLVLASGMAGSVKARKLTPLAALTGGLTGFLVFLGSGYTGILLMTAFFLLGTAATSWKHSVKQQSGVAEKNKGRRVSSQVLANAGVAGILGLLAVVHPQQTDLWQVMLAASFSSATADTLSSELGNVYGSRYYHILGFQKATRGPDGVISLEGTLCGLAGSMLIALIFAIGNGWGLSFFYIIIAGFIGNLADSILGATLQSRGLLNNDAVNFCNTLIGALAGGLFYATL